MAGYARGVDGPCTTHGDNRVPKRWPGMGCGRASCVCPDPSQASDLERFNPVFIDPWDMNSPRESPRVALDSLLKPVGWREHSLQHRGGAGAGSAWGWEGRECAAAASWIIHDAPQGCAVAFLPTLLRSSLIISIKLQTRTVSPPLGGHWGCSGQPMPHESHRGLL